MENSLLFSFYLSLSFLLRHFTLHFYIVSPSPFSSYSFFFLFSLSSHFLILVYSHHNSSYSSLSPKPFFSLSLNASLLYPSLTFLFSPPRSLFFFSFFFTSSIFISSSCRHLLSSVFLINPSSTSGTRLFSLFSTKSIVTLPINQLFSFMLHSLLPPSPPLGSSPTIIVTHPSSLFFLFFLFVLLSLSLPPFHPSVPTLHFPAPLTLFSPLLLIFCLIPIFSLFFFVRQPPPGCSYQHLFIILPFIFVLILSSFYQFPLFILFSLLLFSPKPFFPLLILYVAPTFHSYFSVLFPSPFPLPPSSYLPLLIKSSSPSSLFSNSPPSIN
ncbi:SNRK2 [Acanthosepion pharaonis]|uniref:SNRK2 n=1 Tax=Acanthosepion pharaonis TaxID=158019 RepID=A0A812E032_ACAPH|nr:SNRK2 [Sepia pharaonis]